MRNLFEMDMIHCIYKIVKKNNAIRKKNSIKSIDIIQHPSFVVFKNINVKIQFPSVYMMINNPLEFKGQIIYFCDDVLYLIQDRKRVETVMPLYLNHLK